VLSHHTSTSSGSRGQSNVETTIIVSDIGSSINNDNTQVIVTHLPKSSNTSKVTQQTSKISTSSHSNVQSSSGTMTGANLN